jgi:Ni/Co efflux regulator RcnB
MRTIILSILLASAAAAPAIAQDHGRRQQEATESDRNAAREARQQQREQAREQRSGGGADVARVREQPQPQAQPQQPPPPVEARRQRSDGGNFGGDQQNEAQQQQRWQGRGGSDARRSNDRGNAQTEVQAPQVDQQRQFDGRNRGNWNGGDRRNLSGGDLRQGDRATPNVMRDRNPLVVNDPRQQAQRSDGRRWANGGWNRDWRNDRRYDWRRYRNSHRSIFRIGIYYDPFGYNYRPFDVGYRLYPAYLGQQYWIDPAMYQLPYPPPGTTWVRYWNDALLVDMYSGEVVDVIRDFFW